MDEKSENELSAMGDNGNNDACNIAAEGSAVRNSILRQKVSLTLAPAQKTKGPLLYKKKGHFNMWKDYYAFLDEGNSQLNFYKKESDHNAVNTCKTSVDLRFVDKILPCKGGILSKRSYFKIYRKAGLSTVQLATPTDEDRAEWITTLDFLSKRVKYSPELRDPQSTTSANLSRKQSSRSYACPSDLDKSRPLSSSEEYQIKPRKVSNLGILINSSVISNIKLKRASLEAPINDRKCEEIVERSEEPERNIPFGIQLKKVDLKNKNSEKFKESTFEESEFQVKYNSLSKTKNTTILTLNENPKEISEEKIEVSLPNSSPRVSPRSSIRNNPYSYSIPLTRSAQPINLNVQNNSNLETTINDQKKDTEINVPSDTPDKKICHAITTEIPKFDCELKELNENKLNIPPNKSEIQEMVVALKDFNNDKNQIIKQNSMVSKDKLFINKNISERMDLNENSEEFLNCSPKNLKSSLEVTLSKALGPRKPPRSNSLETKGIHNKVKKIISYGGTTDLQHEMRMKDNLTSKSFLLQPSEQNTFESNKIPTYTEVCEGREKQKHAENTTQSSDESPSVQLDPLLMENTSISNHENNKIDVIPKQHISENEVEPLEPFHEFEFSENEITNSVTLNNAAAVQISNDIVIAAINNAFDECLLTVNDMEEYETENVSTRESATATVATKSGIPTSESIEFNKSDIDRYINEANYILKEMNEKELKNQLNKSEKDHQTNHCIGNKPCLNVQISVTQSDEAIEEMQENLNSPVEIRNDYLRKSLHDEDTNIKRPSTISVLSSESDDPLPKFYFLGKSNRSSCNSSFFREQISIDEGMAGRKFNEMSEMMEIKKDNSKIIGNEEDAFYFRDAIKFSNKDLNIETLLHDYVPINTPDTNAMEDMNLLIEENEIPVFHDDQYQENKIPVFHDDLHQENKMPVLHDNQYQENIIPVFHDDQYQEYDEMNSCEEFNLENIQVDQEFHNLTSKKEGKEGLDVLPLSNTASIITADTIEERLYVLPLANTASIITADTTKEILDVVPLANTTSIINADTTEERLDVLPLANTTSIIIADATEEKLDVLPLANTTSIINADTTEENKYLSDTIEEEE